MNEFLLAVLLGLAILAIGVAALDAIAARRRVLRARLRDWGGGSPEPLDASADRPAAGILARIGRGLVPGGASRTLEDQLAQAGFYGKPAAAAYLATKMMLLVIGLGLSGFLVLPSDMPLGSKALVIMAAGSALFFLPNVVVGVLRARRRRRVWRDLPNAIDLMEVCVSSGMGLDMAWNVVAEEMRGSGSSLADEMALTDLEIHLGASRLEATRHMAARTGVEEVSSFASMLVQSERFGTSIAQALETFAASMREERSTQAQEAAEKTAVKLIIPMALLMMPALLLIVVGPGIMIILEALE